MSDKTNSVSIFPHQLGAAGSIDKSITELVSDLHKDAKITATVKWTETGDDSKDTNFTLFLRTGLAATLKIEQ